MKILPVIVLYCRNINNCDSIASLSKSPDLYDYIDTLFVHDNTPEPCDYPVQFEQLKVHYVHDMNNSGVSKAYNQAAKYAQENGYEWLLLLDQDTVLPDDALTKYQNAINEHPDLPIYAPILRTKEGAICSPCTFKWHRGFTPKSINLGKNSLKELSPINSCMLVNVEKLIQVGGYNENAFLDFSDFQFIERVSKKYTHFSVVNFTAEQDFSNDTKNEISLIRRFKIYCKCALGCEKNSLIDRVQYFTIVMMRATKLFLRTKNVQFFSIFLLHYALKRTQ